MTEKFKLKPKLSKFSEQSYVVGTFWRSKKDLKDKIEKNDKKSEDSVNVTLINEDVQIEIGSVAATIEIEEGLLAAEVNHSTDSELVVPS